MEMIYVVILFGMFLNCFEIIIKNKIFFLVFGCVVGVIRLFGFVVLWLGFLFLKLFFK